MRYGNHRRRRRSRHVRRRPRRFESLEARVVLDAALADAASDPPIAFYFIADVESDETLTELTPGATIDPALVAGREVTLYALANLDDSEGASIESAIVTLDSGPSNRENVSPYAWLGDTNGDFKSGVVLEEGSHVFRAIFYSENNASGTLLEDVSLQFSVESGSENQPPVAVADGGATSEDTSTVIDVLANDTDPDGDTLEVQSVGDAENGVTSIDGNGNVVYQPNANYFGADSFVYTVTDGNGGSDTATVNLDVAPVNDAPVASDDSSETTEGSSVAINVLANDTDVEGDALTIQSLGDPSNGAAEISGDTIVYTPSVGFVGDDQFTYTIDDGMGGQATASVFVTVAAVNESLARYFIADSDSNETLTELRPGDVIDPSLVSGRQVTFYALANLEDSEGARIDSAVVSLDDGPPNTENVSPYALFGDSNGDFRDGVDLAAGAHVFRVIFFAGPNGGGELLADVLVDFTVGPTQPNEPPDAVDDVAQTDEDIAVRIDVLANDTDPNSDPLSVESVGAAGNGTVLIEAGGTVLYTPATKLLWRRFVYLHRERRAGPDRHRDGFGSSCFRQRPTRRQRS